MVLQPLHEHLPRGRVRDGLRLTHAGRPVFLRWLPDSLFHYHLSTAWRSPFIRSWNLASFTDLISCFARRSIDGRGASQLRICDLDRCCREPLLKLRRPQKSNHQNLALARFTICLLLSIRVVVSLLCQISCNCSLLEFPHPAMRSNYMPR
jgi:hypothetical protein